MSDLSLERPEDGPMTIALRPGTPEDAEACGQICHRAFTGRCHRSTGIPPTFRHPKSASA